MSNMLWLLGAAIIAVLYPYLIFPVLLGLLSGKAKRAATQDTLPSVAVLVSAYIEAERIEEKIRNFESLDYPQERLQLWIGTDGSPDNTAEIIRRVGASRVHLVERPGRSGKTAVLNDLASRAKADIFVFSDVNALYRPDTVRMLVAPFADPKVGVVSGRTIIRGGDGQAAVEGAYYRFEAWLKKHESRNGWLAGALGAVYAIRAKLYRELAPELINDLAHPCQAAAQGFECRFEPQAISEEAAGDDAGREFSRQTRMTAQAAYVLVTHMPPLLRAGNFGQFWILLSHKWLRWTAGIWIITAAIVLPFVSLPLTALALAGAMILFAGWKSRAKWATIPVYFLVVHTAYLNGLWRALRGDRFVVWKPRAG